MNGYLVPTSSLDLYLREVSAFPLLSREEERQLALRWYEQKDGEAAHRLVVSNLRFVVKIAMEYRRYGMKLKDLIQEGNVGLMMAVKKFNPHRGFRLISYAVWWIRAYIQKYILDMWSLVRIGKTQAQRKLFRSLSKTWSRLKNIDGSDPSDMRLARALEVREKDVVEMRQRLAAHDASLDQELGEEGGRTAMDLLPAPNISQEEALAVRQSTALVHRTVEAVLPTLNEKEKVILAERLYTDEPKTLEEIGARYSISRERVRQLEERVKGKIRGLLTAQGYSAA